MNTLGMRISTFREVINWTITILVLSNTPLSISITANVLPSASVEDWNWFNQYRASLGSVPTYKYSIKKVLSFDRELKFPPENCKITLEIPLVKIASNPDFVPTGETEKIQRWTSSFSSGDVAHPPQIHLPTGPYSVPKWPFVYQWINNHSLHDYFRSLMV